LFCAVHFSTQDPFLFSAPGTDPHLNFQFPYPDSFSPHRFSAATDAFSFLLICLPARCLHSRHQVARSGSRSESLFLRWPFSFLPPVTSSYSCFLCRFHFRFVALIPAFAAAVGQICYSASSLGRAAGVHPKIYFSGRLLLALLGFVPTAT
jgi:hypothetical protein